MGRYGKKICAGCDKEKHLVELYSFGVYAGRRCPACSWKFAQGFRDHCGLDQPQGTQADIDEIIEPEDYY